MTDIAVKLYNRYYYYDDGSLEEQVINYGDVKLDIGYTYDKLGRLTSKNYSQYSSASNTFDNDVSLTYRTVTGGYSTAQVQTYTSTVGDTSTTYTYTYDYKGNITKIVYSTGEEIRYYYDDLSQLIREDNGPVNLTYVYTYDNAGNITSKYAYELTYSETINTNLLDSMSYSYEDTTFGDMLTCFMSNYISYDAIGNPLSYYNGFNFTWEGRQLVGATSGNNSYTFAYNDEGNRISKTVNGVKTSYAYDGYMLISEYGSDYTIIYLYDAEGGVIGMRYRASSHATGVWDTYWYEKNIFGDIVAVYDNNGTKLISYTYDAWGKFSTRYHNGGANTTAVKNPFKYRGYYYDSDLGLYYLQTRYYDSTTGRFINADSFVSTGQGLLGYNMYAYCGNNPVMHVDPNGKWAVSLGGAFFAVAGGGISYGVAIVIDDNWNVGIQVTEANVLKGKSGGVFGFVNAGISAKGGVSANADTIYDLNGESYSISASAFNYGIEASTSNIMEPLEGTIMLSASYGASLANISIEAGASKTTTVASMNIGDFFNSIWEGICSWFN